MKQCRPSSGVEHLHGKEGVAGSIPAGGSICLRLTTIGYTMMDAATTSPCSEPLHLPYLIKQYLLNDSLDRT
ncbi:MAG: hypothetical protein UY85_C0004G0006 [Candidatus Peribacteria bacterium GW2011_GWB1_54_5]|nr:MAG: hypothetical protein UY85_C0004G0006 [Candidatus Peribacteria bacterium GW2011_GWB1_54_5]KKW43131.1 MAG: hypothetical protein UY90_C0030G0014 [Candidatus Peregrinibacteria bacterium GW2011_GWA2_54_9]